jgi:hypothetical protein
LQTHPQSVVQEAYNPLGISTGNTNDEETRSSHQIPLVTHVWAHAALLYLFVVVSGWQPASAEVSYHVAQVLDLLSNQIKPHTWLRTMVWPFAIAGIFAQAPDESLFRALVQDLQPVRLFGTIRKALEIMENVWRDRYTDSNTTYNLATFFNRPGELVLLV